MRTGHGTARLQGSGHMVELGRTQKVACVPLTAIPLPWENQKGGGKRRERQFPSLKFGVGSTHLKAPSDGSSPPPLVAPNPDPARPVVGALRVCACVSMDDA